ncbi:unnamed protein product [Protopolystoma xenopodis]|uniref:Uncharacterized protein n=1 Tax=Protopolystoma xenopodis TaxID=117903 RepID=A0A448X668_9PLAT|nr:unnamed protein product [Protopolystoma xenopodis]
MRGCYSRVGESFLCARLPSLPQFAPHLDDCPPCPVSACRGVSCAPLQMPELRMLPNWNSNSANMFRDSVDPLLM